MCRSREGAKAELMVDVLVTQHSRWTARRIHRALFGQSLINFEGESWNCVSSQAGKSSISNRCKHKHCAMGTHILSRFSQQFTSSPEADTSNAVEVAEEGSSDSDVSAVSSAEDDEDESIAVSRRRGSATLSVFPGIGTDGLATAPVCDIAFHPEDPTSSEVEHFFAPPPDVDQSANSHRTEFFDISS